MRTGNLIDDSPFVRFRWRFQWGMRIEEPPSSSTKTMEFLTNSLLAGKGSQARAQKVTNSARVNSDGVLSQIPTDLRDESLNFKFSHLVWEPRAHVKWRDPRPLGDSIPLLIPLWFSREAKVQVGEWRLKERRFPFYPIYPLSDGSPEDWTEEKRREKNEIYAKKNGWNSACAGRSLFHNKANFEEGRRDFIVRMRKKKEGSEKRQTIPKTSLGLTRRFPVGD